MPYTYTPPTWRNVQMFPGAWALRYGVPTCTTVYRLGGVWFNVQVPGMDNPVVKSVDTDPTSGLFLWFTTPTVVPDSLFAEMNANALTPSGYVSSWTPGTLVHV